MIKRCMDYMLGRRWSRGKLTAIEGGFVRGDIIFSRDGKEKVVVWVRGCEIKVARLGWWDRFKTELERLMFDNEN